MNQSLQQVVEFHNTFSHPVGNIDELEPLSVRRLRIKLLFEELQELAEASDCKFTMAQLCNDHINDIVHTGDEGEFVEAMSQVVSDGNNVNQLEQLDAFCDLQYVLNGAIITAGMHEIFDKNFDLVHENNMSKAHATYEKAIETKNQLKLTSYNIYPKENGLFVLVNSAGKIIKPHDHKKVELSLK